MRMAKMIVAMLMVAVSAGTLAQSVGRPFSCSPQNGVSTCMQDVLLLDDITMAVLTGASDEVVEATVDWVTQARAAGAKDFGVYTQRLTALAFRDGLNLAPRKTALHRRAEVGKTNRFLLPFASIKTMPKHDCGPMFCSDSKQFFKLEAIEYQSRVSYSADGVDVCSTTSRNRFCVRLLGVDPSQKLSRPWNAMGERPGEAFAAARPHFGSDEWNKNTLLGVEIEVVDRKPMAIDGARFITARPVRLVMFNHGYLGGMAMIENQAKQAGEER